MLAEEEAQAAQKRETEPRKRRRKGKRKKPPNTEFIGQLPEVLLPGEADRRSSCDGIYWQTGRVRRR